MSQQIFDKHWPLAKNGANELIPGAAILQTRDDKDEPITLAAAVQWDESSGLFLPTHKENPLEVRVRELEAKLDELKQTIESGVQLKGSVAQVLDDERATGFGGRVYYSQSFTTSFSAVRAVPIVGKTVTIWFHNLSDRSTRNGVKLHWFLGGTVHDGIPEMDFGDVPAGSVLGIRIGGSAPDNDKIIHVPRFGGDGVAFSVDIISAATGNVRTVIMEESSYA